MKSKNLQLMCVDDEVEVLAALKRIFRNEFEVICFDNPLECLKYIRENQSHPSIIISDFKMPEMNGIDFLKETKALTADSVRIILSGQIEMDQLAEAINTDVIHKFYSKPWDNQVLKLQVLEAIKTHELTLEKNHFKNLSLIDPVTGLFNHRYFQENLRHLIKVSSELNLIMVDVDHFKKYNDTFGHPAGDRMLRLIGNRIKTKSEALGCTVARYGGEEFAVLLPNYSLQQTQVIFENIKSSFTSDPLQVINKQHLVTISVGIANSKTYPTPTDLVEAADKALYKAKENGRNQVIAI